MKNARNRRVHPIRDPRQIEVLGSPARQEVLDGLQAVGPCSIAELAESLGRAPDSLYYHIRKLEQVGLVVTSGTRRSGARQETLYDTPGRMTIDHEPSTKRERERLMRLVSGVLRIAERDCRSALDEGRAVYRPGPSRNTWGGRVKGWLTPAERGELLGHLEAISDLIARGRRRPGASLHAVSFLFAPVAPTRRGAPRQKTREEE